MIQLSDFVFPILFIVTAVTTPVWALIAVTVLSKKGV